MKTTSVILAAALMSVASAASAQSTHPLQAFPEATGISLGVSSFGLRSRSAAGAQFSYKGSVVVAGHYDHPLSRRTGLLVGVGVAPLSQQRAKGGQSVVLSDKLMIGIADAAVGFRFKPVAPIFFSAGGGMTYSTKSPANGVAGTVAEPHALIAIGYDTKSDTKWNVRSVFTNRLVFVGDDGDTSTTAESSAYDWTFEIGGRYRLGGR